MSSARDPFEALASPPEGDAGSSEGLALHGDYRNGAVWRLPVARWRFLDVKKRDATLASEVRLAAPHVWYALPDGIWAARHSACGVLHHARLVFCGSRCLADSPDWNVSD